MRETRKNFNLPGKALQTRILQLKCIYFNRTNLIFKCYNIYFSTFQCVVQCVLLESEIGNPRIELSPRSTETYMTTSYLSENGNVMFADTDNCNKRKQGKLQRLLLFYSIIVSI